MLRTSNCISLIIERSFVTVWYHFRILHHNSMISKIKCPSPWLKKVIHSWRAQLPATKVIFLDWTIRHPSQNSFTAKCLTCLVVDVSLSAPQGENGDKKDRRWTTIDEKEGRGIGCVENSHTPPVRAEKNVSHHSRGYLQFIFLILRSLFMPSQCLGQP